MKQADVHKVEKKLKSISQVLMDYDYQKLDSIGLHGGISGVLLFLFHYARYTEEEKYSEKATALLYRAMDFINNNKADFSFSQGISGFGWAIEHLAENGFIEKTPVLYPLDKILCEEMLATTKEGYWDALHGGIGIAQYLFYRTENKAVHKAIATLVEYLKQQSRSDENGLKWKSINYLRREQTYNFGLAHGMPSIVVFLKKCIDHKINSDLAAELMEKAIQYILKQKTNLTKPPNLYPMYILEGKVIHSERLAWCYGDPGILLSFIQANKVLRNLDAEISQLTQAIANRKSLRENKIMDACICHGTAGMIPILQIARREKALQQYLSAPLIEYWVNQTLVMGDTAEGLAGYKHYSIVNFQPHLSDAISLLDGITGTAFGLLSFLNDDLSWSRCLMMR